MDTKFKETKIGCIPEEWDIKKFSDLAQYINGRAFKPQDWGRTGLPIIRILQLNDPTADCDYYDGEVDERNIIVNGDLVFSWSATLAVIIWNRGKAALNQHLFKVVPSDDIDKRFLRYRIDASIEYLARMSHGSTMKHIKKGVLDEVSVAIPPLPEQRKIAEILSTVDEAIEKTDAIIQETQQLKKGLMQKLFTEGIGHTRFKETKIGRIPEE